MSFILYFIVPAAFVRSKLKTMMIRVSDGCPRRFSRAVVRGQTSYTSSAFIHFSVHEQIGLDGTIGHVAVTRAAATTDSLLYIPITTYKD